MDREYGGYLPLELDERYEEYFISQGLSEKDFNSSTNNCEN